MRGEPHAQTARALAATAKSLPKAMGTCREETIENPSRLQYRSKCCYIASMDLDEIRKQLARPTRARRRAEAQGFVFDGFDARTNPNAFNVLIKCRFTCVCGTPEQAVFVIDEMVFNCGDRWAIACALDIAQRLTKYGSFSEKHLRLNGYTEQQIAEITAKGRQFDMDNPE